MSNIREYVLENYSNASYSELRNACRQQQDEAEACSKDLRDLVKEHLGVFVALEDQLIAMNSQPDLLFRGSSLSAFKQTLAGIIHDGNNTFQPMFDRSDKLATIKSSLACLNRFQSFFGAPNAIKGCIERGDLDAVAHIYKRTKAFMLQTKGEKIFQKVFNEVTRLVADVRQKLISQLTSHELQSPSDFDRLLTLLHNLDIGHNPAMLFLNTKLQSIKDIFSDASHQYHEERMNLWLDESRRMAKEKFNMVSALEDRELSASTEAIQASVPEEELDKCAGAPLAAFHYLQHLTDIIQTQLRGFWHLMGKDVFYDQKYTEMQEEDEDLVQMMLEMVEQVTSVYATECRSALAVVEQFGTGARWASSLLIIFQLGDDLHTWGCCQEYISGLQTFCQEAQAVFFENFCSNLVQEIQGLEKQMLWRQQHYTLNHQQVHCTNLPLAFLTMVQSSLDVCPHKAFSQSHVITDLFEASLSVFVDVMMDLALQEETKYLATTHLGGNEQPMLPTSPVKSAVGNEDPLDRLLLLLSDLLVFRDAVIDEVVERFEAVYHAKASLTDRVQFDKQPISEMVTSAIGLVLSKYVACQMQTLTSLIVQKGFLKPALAAVYGGAAGMRPYAMTLILEVALVYERLQRFLFHQETINRVMAELSHCIIKCYAFCCEGAEFGPPSSAAAQTATLQLEIELEFLVNSLRSDWLPKRTLDGVRGCLRGAYEVDASQIQTRTLTLNQNLMTAQNCCKMVTASWQDF